MTMTHTRIILATVGLLLMMANPAWAQEREVTLTVPDVSGPETAAAPADEDEDEDEDEDAAPEGDDPEAPTPAPTDEKQPAMVVLHLMDGSVISGELGVNEIHVDTDYGRLTVPVEALMSFRPGLQSHPELGSRIEGLIEQLGAVQESDRERAKRDLLGIGPLAMEALRKHLNDTDAERKLRVRQTLDELLEMQDDAEDDPTLEISRPLAPRDEIVTQRFTILGDIVEDEFQLASKYGPLRVALADVRQAQRPSAGGREEIVRKVTVRGGTFAPNSWEETSIRLERGDRVTLKADGQLTLTPWGGGAVSGPEGSTNHGNAPDGSPMGALLAKVGKDGEQMMVGRDKTFTVQKPGVLLLAIAMHPSYINNQFPGGYDVKVRAIPRE